MTISAPHTTAASDEALAALTQTLAAGAPHERVRDTGLAYLAALEAAQLPPPPPDVRTATAADLATFFERLRYPDNRMAWGLALAARAFDAGRDDIGDAAVELALTGGGSLAGAEAIALIDWLASHLGRLRPEQLRTTLDRTGFVPLSAAQARTVADRLVAAWATLGETAPARALAQLAVLAAWAPEKSEPFWPTWRPIVTAEAVGAVARTLAAAGGLSDHLAAIRAILEQLGAPGRTLACLPPSDALRAHGLEPQLADLLAHPDVVLGARGVADWLAALGPDAPDHVLPLLGRGAFKAFHSAYNPHRAPQARIARAAKAYRALVPHFPVEAVKCLDAMLEVADPLGRLRGRTFARTPRPKGLKLDAPVRTAVVLVNRWSGPIDMTTSGKLAAARAIALERPGMAVALIRKALAGWSRPLSPEFSPAGKRAEGLWLDMAFSNPVSDKVRNLLYAAETVKELPAEHRTELEREIGRLIAQEETWLRSFDAKGVKDLVYADGVGRLAPEVARRVLEKRRHDDRDVALVVEAVREALGGLTPAAESALFCATSELWDHENRLWSRQMMLALVATMVLESEPAGACRIAETLERNIDNTKLDAFKVDLALRLAGRPETRSCYRFRSPLLDEHPAAPGRSGTGWIFAQLLGEDAEPDILHAAIAREPDPYARAFLCAWTARRPDALGEVALAQFERMMPGLTDDWRLARLVCDVALFAGPFFGGREERVYRALIAAVDENFMHDPEEVGPLVFRAIHRLPAPLAEKLLAATVDLEPMAHDISAFAAPLMQFPTSVPAERQAALLARVAERLMPELPKGLGVNLAGFVDALARLDVPAARAVCEAYDSDYQGDAYLALLPYDPAGAIAYAREQEEDYSPLTAARADVLAALVAEDVAAGAFESALHDDPKGAPAFLALARRAFPAFPTWLVEAHATHGVWEPLLDLAEPWPAAVCERFEGALRKDLQLPEKQVRFWPSCSGVAIRWGRYFDREPVRAAEAALAWFKELDYAARYAAVRLIATSSLSAAERSKYLVRLIALALELNNPTLVDRLVGELSFQA